jgi:hypothetical protein
MLEYEKISNPLADHTQKIGIMPMGHRVLIKAKKSKIFHACVHVYNSSFG